MSLPKYQQVALDQIRDDIESYDNGATPPANLLENYRPLTHEELLLYGCDGQQYEIDYILVYYSALTCSHPDFLLWFPNAGDYRGYSPEEIEAAELKGWLNLYTFIQLYMDGTLFSELLSDPTYKTLRLEHYEQEAIPLSDNPFGFDLL